MGRRVQNPTPGREGWLRSRLLEGTDVYVAFATAPFSGWRVVLTAPVEAVDGPLRRFVWQMLAGAAAAAAIAGLLAFIFGRRIARAVGALVGIARAVERGEGALPLSTGVTEVDAVAEQLRAAAALARAREQDAGAGERRARAIGEVAHALNASPDLDTVLRTAVEAVRGLVQADSSRIAIVDDAGRLVLRHSTQTPTAMEPGFAIERGMGIGGLAWDAGEPIRTDDIRADPRFRGDRYLPVAQADGIVSCMAVPIVTAGTVVGVIYANNFARRPFTAGDEALVVTLAHHAAVAVQKARLLAREHAARAEAEAASRGKDELLAMLGHELRNPLSAIANAVAVLGIPSAPPEIARRAREIIARQNTHLAHLVDDLLDVARVTSGKIALERASGGAGAGGAAEHRDARRERAHRAPPGHRRARSRVGQRGRDALRADRRQPGGQCAQVHAGGGQIEVALRAADGLAVLRVRDSGIGIAPEMLARVFDLFVQGERSARPRLGRPRARAHPGAPHRRAARGQRRGVERRTGARQRVHRAPARDGAARGARRPGRAPTATAPRAGSSSWRTMPTRARCCGSCSSWPATRCTRRWTGPPGSRRPSTCGPTSRSSTSGCPASTGSRSRAGCALAMGASIHLVALTGYGQPDDRRLALEAGFDAHLVKPVDPPALLAAIRAVFSAAREA